MNDNERMLLRAVVDNDPKKAHAYAKLILNNITAQRDQRFKAELLRKLEAKTSFIELPYNLKDLLVAEDVTDYPMGKFLLRSGEEAIADKILATYRASNRLMELGISYLPAAILYGQSGTGKTELARYIAHKADLPFVYVRFSSLINSLLGGTQSNINKVFSYAKISPCLLCFDEIDAIGKSRDSRFGSGNDEREQTLNQLLVEMDGFNANEGIIVMSATNRVDILDPAILRPGRFDRKVMVGRPDVKGREEILSVHAKGKPLGDDVDLKEIARTTSGFTGADLENLLNESAILAAKGDRNFITGADIKEAFVKVGIGVEKKSRVISEKEKKVTAYHEAGHAILFHVLPDVGPVYSVSIIPTGIGAAGYTMPLPEKDEMFNTKGRMLQDIMVDLGGRIAEELVFDDITTGASQDIKQATGIARSMITKYGMSEKIGLIHYGSDEDEVFIGRDLAHTRSYAENTASVIDAEVKRIVDECYEKAKKLLLENEAVLHRCAGLLLEKEKIGREEFEGLWEAC